MPWKHCSICGRSCIVKVNYNIKLLLYVRVLELRETIYISMVSSASMRKRVREQHETIMVLLRSPYNWRRNFPFVSTLSAITWNCLGTGTLEEHTSARRRNLQYDPVGTLNIVRAVWSTFWCTLYFSMRSIPVISLPKNNVFAYELLSDSTSADTYFAIFQNKERRSRWRRHSPPEYKYPGIDCAFFHRFLELQ